MELDHIGSFEYKYYMYFKPEIFDFLGTRTTGLLKFNCIENGGKVTDSQIKDYKAFKANESILNANLGNALKAYKESNNIPTDATARVTSVEFTPSQSYFLIETSWAPEEGLAVQFNLAGNITGILSQDEVL